VVFVSGNGRIRGVLACMEQGTTINLSDSRRALWACYGGMMCIAVASNLLAIYLTVFGETFGGAGGLNEEQLGRIPGVVFLFFIFGILVSGPLADRWGGKLFVLLGLALTVLGLCLLAAAQTYGALLGAAAVMGAAAGILDMVLSPIVSALRPNNRGSAMNWLHSFYCIGALGIVIIGSGAIHWGISWRLVSLALAILPAFLLVVFSSLTIPSLVHRDAIRLPLRELLREPFFLAALLAIALAGAIEQGMAAWLPAFTERGLGYSKTIGALSLAGFSVGMIVGRVVAAIIQRYIGLIPMMIGGCVLSFFLFGVACFYVNAPVALAACILVGFSGGCLWPTLVAVTANHCPYGGATMFALLSAAGNGGCFVMAWVVGIVAMYSNLNLGLATTALCPATLVLVLIWMGARGER